MKRRSIFSRFKLTGHVRWCLATWRFGWIRIGNWMLRWEVLKQVQRGDKS